jgi:hypothetical protein
MTAGHPGNSVYDSCQTRSTDPMGHLLDRPPSIAKLHFQERKRPMIRVRLFDGNPDAKYVDFHRIPVCSEEDFRCQPEGLVSLETAQLIAKELDAKAMHGRIYGYKWCRQARAD